MKTSISFGPRLHLLVPILLMLLLPISAAPADAPTYGPTDTQCVRPPPLTQSPSVFPKSALVDFYYQPPSQASAAQLLDRLDSSSRIRNKLSFYSLAADGKNFSSLGLIFAKDALVNFSSPLGVVKGLDQIEQVVETALAPYITQSVLGTQVIKVYENNPCTASSLTYFIDTFYGTGEQAGKIAVVQGEFRDGWVKDEAGEWLIYVRLVVYANDSIKSLNF